MWSQTIDEPDCSIDDVLIWRNWGVGVDRQEARCRNQATWTPAQQPSWQSHQDQVGGRPVGDVVTERNMLVSSLWHECAYTI